MMERGYWLPPNHKDLAAYAGYYVGASAVYNSSSIDQDWEHFLAGLCNQIHMRDHTLRKICDWMPCSAGQSRFVVLQNSHVDIIAEDADGYIAVYVIVPERCEAPGYAKRLFPHYMQLLEDTLKTLYPGYIRRRINSQLTETV